MCVCVHLALQLTLLFQSQVLWRVGHNGERRLRVMSENVREKHSWFTLRV